MEKKLSEIVGKMFGEYNDNEVVKKAISDILPDDDDVEKLGVVKDGTILAYSLKENDMSYVLTMDVPTTTMSISVLSDDEQLENLERISINNGKVIYNALRQVKSENGTVITGTSSELVLNRYGSVVPDKICTGIWFYDRKFLDNIGNTKKEIMFLSGCLDPIKHLEDLNNDNYCRYHVLPDMYQKVNAYRKSRGEVSDCISFAAEVETFNRETRVLSFSYSLEDDFRAPIRKLYDGAIKKTYAEDRVIAFSSLENININSDDLGVFNISNKTTNSNEIDSTNKVFSKK